MTKSNGQRNCVMSYPDKSVRRWEFHKEHQMNKAICMTDETIKNMSDKAFFTFFLW